MCRRFDSVVAVSSEDQRQMQTEYGIDSVFEVPTGVDTEFFRPGGKEKTRSIQSRVHRFDGLAAKRRCNPLLH